MVPSVPMACPALSARSVGDHQPIINPGSASSCIVSENQKKPAVVPRKIWRHNDF
jgi:hypothetical protein